MKNKERSFIIDYGCCLPYGHNLHAVNLYRKKEESKGRFVKAIVCKRVESFQIQQKDNFYFSLPTLHKGLIIEAFSNRVIRLYIKFIRIILLFPFVGKNNFLTLRASKSIKQLFKTLQINSNDILIFPSADYYGAKALLKKLATIEIENRPKVHFRFIGSLETPHSFYNHHLPELIALINKNYHTVSVSAEVPIYARYLNSLTPNLQVIAEPFPVEERKSFDNKIAVKNKKPFTILLPGSNRADKGYFDVFHIAKEILFEFPSIKLVVQDMKKQNKFFNRKYRVKLKELANINLVDAVLMREKILELYEDADLILLPYDPGVYHFRGSGIHYEAIQNGIPVLARKGTGFVEEINNWSSGWTYETKQDLLFQLGKILEIDSKEMEEKMKNAFKNFKQYSDEAYRFNLP